MTRDAPGCQAGVRLGTGSAGDVVAATCTAATAQIPKEAWSSRPGVKAEQSPGVGCWGHARQLIKDAQEMEKGWELLHFLCALCYRETWAVLPGWTLQGRWARAN